MKASRSVSDVVLCFLKGIPSKIAIGLIFVYRKCISPLTPASCRFYPTCSEYGMEAIRRFGFLKGGKLAVKRILRCRPKGPYGYDPVPETVDEHKECSLHKSGAECSSKVPHGRKI